MTSTRTMLKWTSGGSLNVTESVPDCQAVKAKVTNTSSSKAVEDPAASFPGVPQSMELISTHKSNREQERERNANYNGIHVRKTKAVITPSKRDRSVPSRSQDWEVKEGQDGNPRKGGIIRKFKNIFRRSSSKGPGSKSAPSSPTPSSDSTHRTETALTPENVIDEQQSGKERRSRLERLIEARKDHRLHRERVSGTQISVDSSLSDIIDDENCRKSYGHKARGGKMSIWNNSSQTADISVSFTGKKVKRKLQNDNWELTSPGLTMETQNAQVRQAQRFATSRRAATLSDTYILPKRDKLEERMKSFNTAPTANKQTVQSSLMRSNYGRVVADTANKDTLVLPTGREYYSPASLLALSPSTKDDYMYLYHWLERVKQIDPVTLTQAKKSLKNIKSGSKQESDSKRLEEIQSTEGNDKKFAWCRSENGGLLVSPKPKLKNSQLLISPQAMPEKTKNSPFPRKSVTRNNNNGHQPLYVQNIIDSLANGRVCEKSSVSLLDKERVIIQPTTRPSCPTAVSERHGFSGPSPHQSLHYSSDIDDFSKVKRIVHSLEERISTSFQAPSPVSSCSSMSSQRTSSSSVISPQQTNLEPVTISDHDQVGNPENLRFSEQSHKSKENECLRSGIRCTSTSSQSSDFQGFNPTLSLSPDCCRDTELKRDPPQPKHESNSVTRSPFENVVAIDAHNLSFKSEERVSPLSCRRCLKAENYCVSSVSCTSLDLSQIEDTQGACQQVGFVHKEQPMVDSTLFIKSASDDSIDPPNVPESSVKTREESNWISFENDELITSIRVNTDCHEANVSDLRLKPARQGLATLSQESIPNGEELRLRDTIVDVILIPSMITSSTESFQMACGAKMENHRSEIESVDHFTTTTSPVVQQENVPTTDVRMAQYQEVSSCSLHTAKSTETDNTDIDTKYEVIGQLPEIKKIPGENENTIPNPSLSTWACVVQTENCTANVEYQSDISNDLPCCRDLGECQAVEYGNTDECLVPVADTVVLSKSNYFSNERLSSKDTATRDKCFEQIIVTLNCQDDGHAIDKTMSKITSKHTENDDIISRATKIESISLCDVHSSEISTSGVDRAIKGVSFSSSDIASWKEDFSLDNSMSVFDFLSQDPDLEPGLCNTQNASPTSVSSRNSKASNGCQAIQMGKSLNPEINENGRLVLGDGDEQENEINKASETIRKAIEVNAATVVSDNKATSSPNRDPSRDDSVNDIETRRINGQCSIVEAAPHIYCPMLRLSEDKAFSHETQSQNLGNSPETDPSWCSKADTQTEKRFQSGDKIDMPQDSTIVLASPSSGLRPSDVAVNSKPKLQPNSTQERSVCANMGSPKSPISSRFDLVKVDAIRDSIELQCHESVLGGRKANVDQMIWADEICHLSPLLTEERLGNLVPIEKMFVQGSSQTNDTEEESLTSSNPPLDSVTARIAKYYNQWLSVRTRLADDSCWDSTTLMRSADLGISSSSCVVTDVSRDGSGDRSAESCCCTAKLLKSDTCPSPLAHSTDALPANAKSVQLVANPKEMQLLKRKRSSWSPGMRLCRSKSKPYRGRNRTTFVSKSQGVRVKRSKSSLEERRPLSPNVSSESNDLELEEDHLRADFMNFARINGKRGPEEIVDKKLLEEADDESYGMRHQPRRHRKTGFASSCLEHKPKQWLFLAAMLFFQFLIHWLYAR